MSATVEAAVAQPNPFLQRYYLLHEVCGEPSASAAFLARWFEKSPLDLEEARIIAAGWAACQLTAALTTESALKRTTPEFCGDEQPHEAHEFLHGARRFDCAGCLPVTQEEGNGGA